MQAVLQVYVLAVAASTTSLAQDDPSVCPPNELWRGGCETDPNLCMFSVDCSQSPCDVTVTSTESNCPIGKGDITENDQTKDATLCEALCIANRKGDTPCRFWRFVSIPFLITQLYYLTMTNEWIKVYCAIVSGAGNG